jgi:hypothetical protein
MGIMDRITKAIDVLTEDESIEKGNNFEKYVIDLFDDRFFSIVDWTRDHNRKHDRIVESDMGPDITVRYEPKNEKFCVECKFRSHLTEGKLEWTYPKQLERYQLYAFAEHRLPFFVVIGLGGSASNPGECFPYH